MSSVYDQWHDGEEMEVREGEDTLKIACCDCGLIHKYSFKRIKGSRRIKMKVTSDRKATATYRRHHFKNGRSKKEPVT